MSRIDKYIDKSLEEYGNDRFFLFDKYFWMFLLGIPLKVKDTEIEKKKENVIMELKEGFEKIDDSIGFE